MKRFSIGSVDGLLESIDSQNRALIACHLDGTLIECRVPEHVLTDFTKLIGQKVIVSGRLTREDGCTASIDAERIIARNGPEMQDSLKQISSLPVPHWASYGSTEEILQRIRG